MFVPENWPKEVKYTNTINKKSEKVISKLEGIEVKIIRDDTHVLNGEFGVYATKEWKPYEIIGCYCGTLVKNIGGKYAAHAYTSKTGDNWLIDASIEGNETRFINDYRNIEDKPNVFFGKTVVNNRRVIIVIVTKHINKGEEILSDYGDSYWDYINEND